MNYPMYVEGSLTVKTPFGWLHMNQSDEQDYITVNVTLDSGHQFRMQCSPSKVAESLVICWEGMKAEGDDA